MAAIAKGVAASFGLVTCSVSLHGAVEKAEGNKTVCCGNAATGEHDPILISQVRKCSTCGEVGYADLKKAREVGGGLVLLENDEIAEAKQDATAFKKQMAMTPHPAAEVEVQTMPGEKAYFLTPDPGHETAYALLVHAIGSHPELAFMCQWTPRSNASQFRITVWQGVLMATERIRTAALKPVPQVVASAPAAMQGMVEQVLALPGTVTDYDPAAYADSYADKIQAIVASKQVVAAGGTPVVASAPALPAGQQSAMDALAAMLAAAGTPAPTPTAAPKKRSTPRKKVPAA